MSARTNILKKLKNIKLSHGSKDFKIDLKKIVPNFKNAEIFFRAKSIENNCIVETAKNIDEINEKILNFIQDNNYSSDLFVWPSIKTLNFSPKFKINSKKYNDEKVGVTSCFCGIAETGSLMFVSSEITPMSHSLLPESHIAIVRRGDIVRTMEDGFKKYFEEKSIDKLDRQICFISGPSRTADIELTMVIGVHGPKRLLTLIVDDL
jgi:L-lactate dehydrogenase complex protein LldG